VDDAFRAALAEAGGASAPRGATAQLRRLLAERLAADTEELQLNRSGSRERPVVAVIAEAAHNGRPGLLGVAPVEERLRADPARASERAWLFTAALVYALAIGADAQPDPGPVMLAGSLDGHLTLWLPAQEPLPDLAVEAFAEAVAGIDRLRAAAVAVGPPLVEGVADLRAPPGRPAPLAVAEAVARAGGNPADPASVEEHADALDAMLGAPATARPHADPVPERRIARRILQRLAGMGKWGGYHTEFRHLARGFEGNDRALALDIGERLVVAGLLAAKQSVGQHHVFLDPRRAADIWALIDEGVSPPGLDLS